MYTIMMSFSIYHSIRFDANTYTACGTTPEKDLTSCKGASGTLLRFLDDAFVNSETE